MPRLLAVVLALVLSDAAGAQTDSVSVLVDALATDSNQTSLDAARELAATGDVRAVAVLESLVAGQLYVRRSDRK
ncbi:MAG: urea ABC transporter permease subunit UrtB, partial [Pseudomonadota bacterium]